MILKLKESLFSNWMSQSVVCSARECIEVCSREVKKNQQEGGLFDQMRM
jgi:hypothetical protein